MRSIPILIVALMIAVIVPHVCAENVTYPQEYYQYKHEADKWSYVLNKESFAYVNPSVATDYRTAAILIVLEKQNELINEQNELLKKLTNQTYSVHYSNLGQYQVGTKEGVYTVIPNL